MQRPVTDLPSFLDQLSRLIAGWNDVKFTPLRLFRARRGRNVYPRKVNEMLSNLPRLLLSLQ